MEKVYLEKDVASPGYRLDLMQGILRVRDLKIIQSRVSMKKIKASVLASARWCANRAGIDTYKVT